jgi:uncharacterized protein
MTWRRGRRPRLVPRPRRSAGRSRLLRVVRRSRLLRRVGAASLAAAAVAYVVLGLLSARTDTTATTFLPPSDPTITTLNEAGSSFGGDPVVVLAESDQPRALLGPDEIPKLIGAEGKLSKLPGVAAVYGPGTVLNQIAGSAQDMMATLSGRRDAVRKQATDQAQAQGATPQAADAAGNDAVAGFDQRYGPLLVRALPAGLPTVRNPSFVDAVTFDQQGAPRSEMQFVVPNQNAVSIIVRPRPGLDQAATAQLVDDARATVTGAGLAASRITVTGTPAVTASLGTTVEQEIPLLGALAVGLIAVCYGALRWRRRVRERLLPVAATLGATLLTLATLGWVGRPLSLGVVAFLPILIGIGSDFPAYLVDGTRRRIVVVTAAASAAGFGSLALSPLPFVRDLGVALAIGVLMTTALGFTVTRFLVRPERPVREAPPDVAPRTTPRWQRWSALAALALVAGVGWALLPHVDVAARPDQLAAGLPAIGDAQHAEDVLGSSGEMQILLRGPDVASPQALQWMRQVEDDTIVQFGDRMRPIVSLPDQLRFLGPSPSPEEIGAALDLVPGYLSGSVLRPDHHEAVMSFGLRLQDIGDQQAMIDALKASLPPTPPGTTTDVTGLPVAAGRAYALVEQDLYLANAAGIVAAGLVLLIGLPRRGDAVRAIVAAALATGWGLAVVMALGVALNPLTVALGSLTTATACEFTVMLIHRGRAGGSGRRLTTVAVAASAAALGYLALAASRLEVIRELGLLLAGAVLLSLAAGYAVTTFLPPRPVAPGRGAGSPDEPPAERIEREEVLT